MLNHPTHEKLNQLKLFGMARALTEQSALDLEHLGFEERLGLLIDRETTERDGRLLTQRLLKWTRQSRHLLREFKLYPLPHMQRNSAALVLRGENPLCSVAEQGILPARRQIYPQSLPRRLCRWCTQHAAFGSSATGADAPRCRTRSTAPARSLTLPCCCTLSGTRPRVLRCATTVRRRCCPALGPSRPY